MANLGALSVFLTANTTPFQKSMFKATSIVGGFSRAVGFIGVALGAGLAVASTKAAAGAEEIRNKFDVVFGEIPNLAEASAERIAESFDLANTTAKDMIGTTGDLLTGFGFVQRDAFKMSQQVASLAGDLASFQDIEGGATEAAKRLTKGILGQTRNLQMMGIVVNQTNADFQQRVKTMMKEQGITIQMAKAQVILAEAFKQSKNAVGDYARTQGSVTNQGRKFLELWKGVKESIGNVVIELLDLPKLLKKINDGFKSLTTSEFVITWQIMAIEVNTAIKNSIAAFNLFWDVIGNGFKTFLKNLEIGFNWIRDNWDTLWKNRWKVFGIAANLSIRGLADKWQALQAFMARDFSTRSLDRFVIEYAAAVEKTSIKNIAKAVADGLKIKPPEFVKGKDPSEFLKKFLDILDTNAKDRDQRIKALIDRAFNKVNVPGKDGPGDAITKAGPMLSAAIRAGTQGEFALRAAGFGSNDMVNKLRVKNAKANVVTANELKKQNRDGVKVTGIKTVDNVL